MKKLKYLIASFSVLLLLIPSVVFADGDPEPEEDPGSDFGISINMNDYYASLDSYFYQNYDLMPYLQSNGYQYINTGVYGSNSLVTYVEFSDLVRSDVSGVPAIFGCADSNNGASINRYYCVYYVGNGQARLGIGSGRYDYTVSFSPYQKNILVYDHDDVYLNDQLIYSFENNDFTSSHQIYIFTNNDNGIIDTNKAVYKLYRMKIYDSSANNGEGGLIRDFYPAMTKSGSILGLYDAVEKTFYPSISVHPFTRPTEDQSVYLQIGNLVVNSVGWVEDIFDFVIEQPMILFFLAIGLAGVAIRWARRVVHF